MSNFWWLIIGVVVGWITKVPLLLHWYKDLKDTKDFQTMRRYKRYLKYFENKKEL